MYIVTKGTFGFKHHPSQYDYFNRRHGSATFQLRTAQRVIMHCLDDIHKSVSEFV